MSSGSVCDLGYQIVWCAKYCRWVLDSRVAARLGEPIRSKVDKKGWQIIALV